MSTSLQLKLRAPLEADRSGLADLLNSGYAALLGEFRFFNDAEFNLWIRQFDAYRTITAQKEFKTYVIGMAGIRNTNYRARQAELIMFAVGPDLAVNRTICSTEVITPVLNWVFSDLGLNRVWMSVSDDNQILDLLEESGWVAEGLRIGNLQGLKGRVDETVCSINITGRGHVAHE